MAEKMAAFLLPAFLLTCCYSIQFVVSQGSSCVTPYTGGCGIIAKAPNFAENFVTAEPEVAPWQAVIHMWQTKTTTTGSNQETTIMLKMPSCGAVIVDKNHVITSASCLGTVWKNDLYTTKIMVGESDLNSATLECQTQTFLVENVFAHPSWNENQPSQDDVAVVKVLGEIQFNQFVRPACLPLSTDGPYFDYSVFADKTFYTAWKDDTSKLIFMTTPLEKTCPSDLSNANSGKYERYNLVCYGGVGGPSCAETKGSPVVAKIGGVWRVIGINAGSIGSDCSTGLAFWRMAFYRDWLLSVGVVQSEGEVDASCNSPVYTGSCGITKLEWVPKLLSLLTPRIISGRTVQAGQLPWQVNLDVDGYQCGGGLIKKNFILTAAHCVFMKSKEKIKANLGDIDGVKRECHEQVSTVAEVIIHPDYDDDNLINDIALLRLTTDVEFNDYVRPICGPPKSHGSYFDYSIWNGKLVAAGWGRTKPGEDDTATTDVLLATDIVVMKDCPIDEESDSSRVVKAEMICSPTKTEKDTCQGDSGGILAAKMDGKWMAIGIVSYGNAECTGEAAYTRVAHYADWIAEKVTESGGPVNPVLPDNLLPLHVESGTLSEVGLYDLKAIFCTVSSEGGVGPSGFLCKDADGTKVPKGNVVCADKIVISKRDYDDALKDRRWDTPVRTGDTLVLESIRTLLNGKGLKGDDIVKCMGTSYGRESGCKLLVPNPKTYLCNDRYIVTEALYDMIVNFRLIDTFNGLIEDASNEILTYPFMDLLRNGSLASDTFFNFVYNDAYYLSYGAANFQLAANNVTGSTTQDIYLRNYLSHKAMNYKKYYDSALQEWGIMDRKQEIHEGHAKFQWGYWQVASEFSNYVTFLESTAKDKKPFLTVIASGPCSLLWPYLGKTIIPVRADNPYKAFIEGAFGPWKWSAKDIVKKYAGNYDRNELIEIFKTALFHEKQCFLKSTS